LRGVSSKILDALLGLPLAWALLSPVCGSAQEVGAAARVNGVEISLFRLERYFQDYLQERGRNVQMMTNPQAYKSLKREALERLIDAELLWQAAQQKNLVAAPEQVRSAMERLRALVGSEEALKRRLDTAGFTEATYLDYLTRMLSSQIYVEREVTAAVSVSDEAVHDFYADNRDKFVRPEQVAARHILIRLDPAAGPDKRAQARQRIDEILAQARKGADFAALAKQHSEDATAASGGNLGRFPRGSMVKAFEDAAFALEPGEISGVVESPFGYHIIRLESREPGGTVPEADVRGRIREYLLAVRRQKAAKDALEALRSKAKIEILVPL
jgi:peptidyl-prolyl cis-trans isomerase C